MGNLTRSWSWCYLCWRQLWLWQRAQSAFRLPSPTLSRPLPLPWSAEDETFGQSPLSDCNLEIPSPHKLWDLPKASKNTFSPLIFQKLPSLLLAKQRQTSGLKMLIWKTPHVNASQMHQPPWKASGVCEETKLKHNHHHPTAVAWTLRYAKYMGILLVCAGFSSHIHNRTW